MSNFSFSHYVFKKLVLQTRKNKGLVGKGLKFTGCFYILCQIRVNKNVPFYVHTLMDQEQVVSGLSVCLLLYYSVLFFCKKLEHWPLLLNGI